MYSIEVEGKKQAKLFTFYTWYSASAGFSFRRVAGHDFHASSVIIGNTKGTKYVVVSVQTVSAVICVVTIK